MFKKFKVIRYELTEKGAVRLPIESYHFRAIAESAVDYYNSLSKSTKVWFYVSDKQIDTNSSSV